MRSAFVTLAVVVVAAVILWVYLAANAGYTEHSCPEPREGQVCE